MSAVNTNKNSRTLRPPFVAITWELSDRKPVIIARGSTAQELRLKMLEFARAREPAVDYLDGFFLPGLESDYSICREPVAFIITIILNGKVADEITLTGVIPSMEDVIAEAISGLMEEIELLHPPHPNPLLQMRGNIMEGTLLKFPKDHSRDAVPASGDLEEPNLDANRAEERCEWSKLATWR